MPSPEYDLFVNIVNELRPQFIDDHRQWAGSPFEWVKGGIASRTKGMVGELIVAEFLSRNNFTVGKSPDSDADIVVNNWRAEVKLSTLWRGGNYQFQQIRNQNYDILFCLGISPHSVHAWVTEKAAIEWDDIANQHGGRAGSDTWWIPCQPGQAPHSWLRPQDGDITKICDELNRIINT